MTTNQSVGSNRIEVNLGGEKRTIVCGMRAYELVTGMLRTDAMQLSNQAEVLLKMVFIGMRNRPSELTEDKLVEWIDDMELSEQKMLREFVNESLGFIIEDFTISLQKANEALMEATVEANKNQPAS